MNYIFKCPNCGKDTELDLTAKEAKALEGGQSIQKALPKRDAFFREVVISHMCYDCQSKIFNRPKPGEDWGEEIGECPECGSPIYEKDTGICPHCKTPLIDDDDVECENNPKCACVECGACNEVVKDVDGYVCGDHECRCCSCAKTEDKED